MLFVVFRENDGWEQFWCYKKPQVRYKIKKYSVEEKLEVIGLTSTGKYKCQKSAASEQTPLQNSHWKNEFRTQKSEAPK